jgi:hypothetical protein
MRRRLGKPAPRRERLYSIKEVPVSFRSLGREYNGEPGTVFPQNINPERLSEVEVLNMELEYGKRNIYEYLSALTSEEMASIPR